MRKPALFPRKPALKKPPFMDPRHLHYGLSFALLGNMLSDEEIEAIKNDQAEIQKKGLYNANAELTFPIGTWATLYEGRRFDLLGDRLLGLDRRDPD